MKQNKKAQMTLGDAPGIVLIVGLVFLVMATMALVGEKYGNAIDTDQSGITINVTGNINTSGYTLPNATLKNFQPSIVRIINMSGNQIQPGNWTIINNVLYNSSASPQKWNNVNITYEFTYSTSTVSSNVTGDLETEISNNTSIAGIVLTISLIGIVLTILIGVFMGVSRRSQRL